MKPVKTLETNYLFVGQLDAGDRRTALRLNLVGLALIFLFGWLFLLITTALRPEASSANLFSLLDQASLLGLIASLIAVLILHELVHGLLFWLFTHERPRFGFHLTVAYAAAPDWYFPRNQFMIINLAPLVLITAAGLILLPILAYEVVPLLFVALTFNAAGSVGDFLVAGQLLRAPHTTMVHDTGPKMIFYQLASDQIAAMSARWLELMAHFMVDGDRARREFANLVEHYEEEGRYYHNLEHIDILLETVNQLRDLAHDLPIIQLAVWYHDVIYDSRSDENEKLSAEAARRSLTALEFPMTIVDRVVELIMATTNHLAPDGDVDAQILLDADLAPLGADPVTFQRQSLALRMEFSWIPDEQYRLNRKRLLRNFLQRERIYQTDLLFTILEEQARQNLSESLDD